ncbi:MAG TPA: hypothetical protein VG759_07175 [Candidatus Angelobacter sp.]|nr:hypothetical protein [Candidatus Angelobacter sp.]
MDARQFEGRLLRCWIGGFCLLLVLFFAGVETTHAHSDPHTRSDTLCLICVSAPTQAPAIAIDGLPLLLTLAMVALPSDVREKSLAIRMELFIRPPPSN